jgi:hypothetical protein
MAAREDEREGDRVVHECIHKLVQVVVQARVPGAAGRAELGNKWFNLETLDVAALRDAVNEQMKTEHGIHSQFQVGTRACAEGQSLSAARRGNGCSTVASHPA